MTAPTAPASLREDVALREALDELEEACRDEARVERRGWGPDPISAETGRQICRDRVDTLIATLVGEPDNETLRNLGAFDRKCRVGKHQATNWVHLRQTIETLDAAGQTDAADTLIWTVWHEVNGAARAREYHRLEAERREAAEAALAAALADKTAAEMQNEALHEKLKALAPHGSCACSYDKPGDVCMHHSPVLAAAQDRIAEMERALEGVSDDYTTSDKHHPRHVLIPVAKFEELRSAEAALRAAQSAHHPEEMHDE